LLEGGDSPFAWRDLWTPKARKKRAGSLEAQGEVLARELEELRAEFASLESRVSPALRAAPR